MLLRLMIYVLIGYVALLLMLFMAQRKLLYLPSQTAPSEQLVRHEGLRYWPSAQDFLGFIGSESLPEVKGTILVFHGNAGAAYQRAYYLKALTNLGYRVILAEYPGYGGRGGSPSEKSLVDDALKTLQRAHREFGGPIFMWGESLGSGVVAGAIAQTEIPVKGLVLFLPWDSLANVAQTHYWYLPVKWLVRDRYASVDNLKHYAGKIAVLLAKDDEVIPFQHGQKLYLSLNTEKRLWTFEDTTHNTVPVDANLEWWGEVVEFMAK